MCEAKKTYVMAMACVAYCCLGGSDTTSSKRSRTQQSVKRSFLSPVINLFRSQTACERKTHAFVLQKRCRVSGVIQSVCCHLDKKKKEEESDGPVFIHCRQINAKVSGKARKKVVSTHNHTTTTRKDVCRLPLITGKTRCIFVTVVFKSTCFLPVEVGLPLMGV